MIDVPLLCKPTWEGRIRAFDPRTGRDGLHDPFGYYDANFRHHLPEGAQGKNARILDFGPGNGELLRYLRERGYLSCSGVDVDAGNAAIASGHSGFEVAHRVDSLGFLREKPGSFDLIIAKQVLYYFPPAAQGEVFRALSSSLKPGGRLIVEVVNGAGLMGSWASYNDPGIQTVFTDVLLGELTRDAGLRIVSLGPERYRIDGVQLKLRLWLMARALWYRVLRLIYLLERGRDSRNPSVFGKNLILVAQR